MEMPAMQLLRAPEEKVWHCCHDYQRMRSALYTSSENASNAAAAPTREKY